MSPVDDPGEDGAPAGLRAWWRVVDAKIGVVPVPVFGLGVSVLAGFLVFSPRSLAADILTNIVALALGGFACAEIGKRLPVLNQIGAAAIFATFAPSYLVYAHVLPRPLVTSITEFTKQSNILYLFITAVIVGSILGMDRRVLIAGFLRIFGPIALGSAAAVLTGVGVGAALGLPVRRALFYVVLPVLAGGVGEGAIPLSVGYGQILHAPSGPLLAQILPCVMFGSLAAILAAGLLNHLGRRRPGLTGEGRLSPEDPVRVEGARLARTPSAETAAAALVAAVCLYLVGSLAQTLWGWPGPVTMLFVTVILKLFRVFSPDLEAGAVSVYGFVRSAVTYPLLFAIGVALTPWDRLIGAFTLANVLTIAATVTAMTGVGFASARVFGLHPVEAGIIAACRCGQGGTGDVAILTAAGRMQLMPFAQIATRIGGALTVALALIAFAQ